MIYIINYYTTCKFAMKNKWWLLRSYFTMCMNRAHLVQAQYSNKWSAIYVFYWNKSCVFHMNILFEVYHICIQIGDFDCMVFTRWVSLNVPDPGTIWDGTVPALNLHCVPPCLLLILDCQRKLTVIHKNIVPHTPWFHCTLHNFGRLTCVSPQWNRSQYEHVTTPWRHH